MCCFKQAGRYYEHCECVNDIQLNSNIHKKQDCLLEVPGCHRSLTLAFGVTWAPRIPGLGFRSFGLLIIFPQPLKKQLFIYLYTGYIVV